MAKRKPSAKLEHTPEYPMYAWLKRDKRGKGRAFYYRHRPHFYMMGGTQRRTNWLPVSIEVVRDLSNKGCAHVCERDKTQLTETKEAANGFFAFLDSLAETANPYEGETFETTTELTSADKWALGWNAALIYCEHI